MVLAASQSASVSLQVRAGKSISVLIEIYDETATPFEMDLSSYEGRLQVRDLRGRRRVLVDSRESVTVNAPLQRRSKGTWVVFLGKSYTSWLPYLSQIEVEMQNRQDPNDVIPLFNGTLSITPEAVSNS